MHALHSFSKKSYLRVRMLVGNALKQLSIMSVGGCQRKLTLLTLPV